MVLSRGNAGRRREGFTLLELLTVMAIICFIMGMTVAGFYQIRRGIELRAAVSTLRANASRTRENAIFKRVPTRLRLISTQSYAIEELRGGVYSAIGESERALPPGVRLMPGWAGRMIGMLTNQAIVFGPDGRTDSLAPRAIHLKEFNNPTEVEIIINGLTGLATVQYGPPFPP